MGNDSQGRYIDNEAINLQSGVDMHPMARITVTTKALLKALSGPLRYNGMEVLVTADNSRWVYSSGSALSDTGEYVVITPTDSTGRWLRVDRHISMKLAIDYTLADAAVLWTVPTGYRFLVQDIFWEVTADFTGGTSSAIGVSASIAPHSTKGDLLGGSAGNVLADLTAAIGVTQGTVGVSISASPKKIVLESTADVRFDRITSVFTAGTGFVHIVGRLIA